MSHSSEPSFLTVAVGPEKLPRKLELPLAGLRILTGKHRGQLLRLDVLPVVIGSDPNCDLVLSDATVSSRHAEIGRRPQGLLLRNLGSRNGVLAGNWWVEQIYLAPQMIITLGETALEVVALDEIEEVKLSSADHFGAVRGRSAAMRRVFAILDQIRKSDASVLLEGETGTGKEIVARELHRQSTRADNPFVVFDCSAIAPNLLESELFGHERGAFTGAIAARTGSLAQANGGTLFLDEIGELGLDMQPKLLRALESREYKTVGGNRVRSVDVRLIAATSRKLENEVKAKQFRQDLFFRLAVMRVRLPPLRERLEDLPLLINAFLEQQAADEEIIAKINSLLPLLSSYHWPGNVRELRNIVERMTILPLYSALPSALNLGGEKSSATGINNYADTRELLLQQFEEKYLPQLLLATGGNVTKAAELSGLSRRHLTHLIAKHSLDPRRFSKP